MATEEELKALEAWPKARLLFDLADRPFGQAFQGENSDAEEEF